MATTRAYREANREKIKAKRHAEYMRQRRAQMTPEQKAEEREKARIRMAARYAAMTDDERRQKIEAGNKARRARREAARKAAEKARKADAVTRRKENRAALNSNPEAVYGRIRRAIPRSIFADIRDDIANDITIALLDGEIGLGEIEASVRTYLSRHFRAREWSSVWSLDAIIPETDGLSLIDTIAA